MKKGFLLLSLLAVASMAFADVTTVTAVKDGEKVNVTITWQPELDYGEVYLRGNYDGDQWGGGKAMTKDGNKWTITITGKAIGETFEYKYFADDEWQDGEENYPVTVGNPFGGVNGFVKVDDGLLAGKLSETFKPNMNAAFTWRPRVVAGDYQGGSAFGEIKSVMWFKINGEVLPGLNVLTQFNAIGDSGDSNITFYNEDNKDAGIELVDLFFKGGDFGGKRVAVLTHFAVEYATEFADIAYLDHYAKPLPETIGANDGYVFRIARNDPASGINSMGGMFRLKKSLPLAEGINLNYLVGWGSIARYGYSGWTADNDWTTQYDGGLGALSFFYVKTPAVDLMLSYNNVAQGVRSNLNNIDDYFAMLDSDFAFGAKGVSGPVTWAAQLMSMFSNRQNALPGGEWNAGKHLNFGAKATIDLAPLSIYTDLVIGGSNYQSLYNYDDFGWEDDGKGYNVEQNLRKKLQIKLNPKLSLDGITVGLDNKISTLSPLYDQAWGATAKDTFYNGKLYGTYDLGAGNVGAMAKFFFNAWETAPADTSAFGLDTVGLGYWMDLESDILKSLRLDLGLKMAGTTTTANANDDSMAISGVLTVGLPMDIYAYAGVASVNGKAVENYNQNTNQVLGYAFGVRQDIKVMDRAGSSLFFQFQSGIEMFDNDETSKLKMSDDYVIDRLGTGAMNKFWKIAFGANLDF